MYYGNTQPGAKNLKERKKADWLKNINYGGNIQAYFGSSTFIYLNPTIGYNVNDRLNVGGGAIYSYLSGTGGVSRSMYGPQVYARFRAFENLAIIGQYDKLFQPDWNSYTADRMIWVDYAMGGIGYMQRAGDHAAFYTNLLYNFTPHRSSIYPSNLILQFGFNTRF